MCQGLNGYRFTREQYNLRFRCHGMSRCKPCDAYTTKEPLRTAVLLKVVMPGSTPHSHSPNDSADRVGVAALLGISPWAKNLRAEILEIAPHPLTVLITGPSGTGKELIAQAIHHHSPRCRKPFIAVDCAAVSGTLFASHLFGHVKGAFTGADRPALGCFRAADGGTLFLDEIGELEPEFQAKLLRVFQARTVTPLGSHEPIPVDIRLIAATNRDLGKMVSSNVS